MIRGSRPCRVLWETDFFALVGTAWSQDSSGEQDRRDQPASTTDQHCEDLMGSVIKKRRKRMAKKKHRKLLRKTRHQRRNKK